MRRALVLALLAALALPATALGHASIRASFPKSTQRLDQAPRRVEVDFDQAVSVFPSGIRVYGARGRIY